MDAETRRICVKILPPGIKLQEGDPPPPPLSFEEDYVLPEHYKKPLEVNSSDGRSSSLSFYEIPHIYTWKNVPTTASVTYLAHEFESPFDSDEAIRLMKTARSQAWPRKEYVLNVFPMEEWTPDLGALMVRDEKTISVLHPHSTTNPSIENAEKMLTVGIIKGQTKDDDVEFYSYSRELQPKEIKNKWSRKGMLTSHMGTEAHFQAELIANGLPFRYWEPEAKVFLNFARDYMVPRGMVTHMTEKELVCADGDVAGSLDLIVYDPHNDLYHIIDHKRTDKLKKDLRGYGKMKAPFSHLDDCKGAGYALQTSLYQYILERDYGMRFGERILLSLHPDNPFVTRVPYLRAEVSYIMENRFVLVRARRKVAEKDPRFKCSLTGAPAVDAVILTEDGKIAMEKAAIIRSMPYTVAEELREEFETLVKSEIVPVELERVNCVSWRRQMPEGGIPPFS